MMERLKEVLDKARAEIGKVIVGQHEAIDLSLITIFTGSHALLEGVPGTGKTLLVRTLGEVLDCDSHRIQFTPDLMPADIIGTNVYNLQTNQFTLVKGPAFTTFLLADEINRAPAKTQSALLQAMQERAITIDRETHALHPAFTVFATQNPIEFEGTYPLPEAQKDRFMFKIPVQCPTDEEEKVLASRFLDRTAPEAVLARGEVSQVVSADELPALRATFDTVQMNPELVAYGVDIVRATRQHNTILVGAGPRATQALLVAARAFAILDDRDFVTPDDIKDMCLPVLGHRLILRPEFELEGLTVDEILRQIQTQVAIPR